MFKDFDRRAGFFFISAFACLLLIPVALPKFRFVGVTLVIVQSIVGLLSLLDHLSRRKSNKRP
jgi:hypothetical protein